MGLSTFIGGVHPYEGKELSSDQAGSGDPSRRASWYSLCPSISALRRNRWWPRATVSWLARRSEKPAASFLPM